MEHIGAIIYKDPNYKFAQYFDQFGKHKYNNMKLELGCWFKADCGTWA